MLEYALPHVSIVSDDSVPTIDPVHPHCIYTDLLQYIFQGEHVDRLR